MNNRFCVHSFIDIRMIFLLFWKQKTYGMDNIVVSMWNYNRFATTNPHWKLICMYNVLSYQLYFQYSLLKLLSFPLTLILNVCHFLRIEMSREIRENDNDHNEKSKIYDSRKTAWLFGIILYMNCLFLLQVSHPKFF